MIDCMQKYEAAAEEQKRAYEKAMAEYRAAINPRPKLMCGDAMALTMAALFVCEKPGLRAEPAGH